ncbi:MAG: neutral/alkaline non-lysosomal ceramidase N-terminal domain-containing protein [Promethearchaeota archaeon]
MKVAFGKIILTPKDFIGRSLAGYVPVVKCDGKLDDIFARGVLIESSHQTENLLIISLDFLKFSMKLSNYIKDKIYNRYNIPQDQILLHATHTHKSLDLGNEYVLPGGALNFIKNLLFGQYYSDNRYKIWVTNQIVKLVGNLIKQVKDGEHCKISWKKEIIIDNIMINRRHPEIESKSQLGIISFRRLSDEKLIGIIINFGTHPTTLNNTISKLSADYPGRVCARVEQETNDEVSAVFFTAPAGDLNPITTCGDDFKTLTEDKKPIYDQMGTYIHTKKIGYFLGDRALKIANAIPSEEYHTDLDFTVYNKFFEIPFEDYKKYWTSISFKYRILHIVKKYFLFRLPIFMASQNPPNFSTFNFRYEGHKIFTKTQIQYFLLRAFSNSNNKEKSLSITAIPGELFEEIGKKILKNSPTGAENSFIFQNSNDWVGYLFPLKEYILVGGYEPSASFSPLTGAYVQNNFMKLVNKIKTTQQ